ncbi:MAG: hypothetical protein ACK5L5_12060 [Bacteroidales bacterium]
MSEYSLKDSVITLIEFLQEVKRGYAYEGFINSMDGQYFYVMPQRDELVVSNNQGGIFCKEGQTSTVVGYHAFLIQEEEKKNVEKDSILLSKIGEVCLDSITFAATSLFGAIKGGAKAAYLDFKYNGLAHAGEGRSYPGKYEKVTYAYRYTNEQGFHKEEMENNYGGRVSWDNGKKLMTGTVVITGLGFLGVASPAIASGFSSLETAGIVSTKGFIGKVAMDASAQFAINGKIDWWDAGLSGFIAPNTTSIGARAIGGGAMDIASDSIYIAGYNKSLKDFSIDAGTYFAFGLAGNLAPSPLKGEEYKKLAEEILTTFLELKTNGDLKTEKGK